MMIPPFPFVSPPFRKSSFPYNSRHNFEYSNKYTFNKDSKNCNNNLKQNSYCPKVLENNEYNKKNENNSSDEIGEYFEIFGLKLYSDDLLIIGLLFFLYEEEVKDTYLYIALILLLLS